MHAMPMPLPLDAVVALDDECRNAADRLPLAVCGREPHAPGETQAEVLVLREALEAIGHGFQDVGCRCPTARNAPTAATRVEVQRDLRLCAGKGELSFGCCAGRRAVANDVADALCERAIVEPTNTHSGLGGFEHFREPRLRHELHSARAVFAYVGQKCDGIARRDLEAPSPGVRNARVVGQESPEKIEHPTAGVKRRRRRHGLRERIDAFGLQPLRYVGEACTAAIALEDARDLTFQTYDELHRESFFRRGLVLCAARMSPSEVPLRLAGARLVLSTQGASPTSSRTPRKLRIRRILPICAVSLPRSISEIQF